MAYATRFGTVCVPAVGTEWLKRLVVGVGNDLSVVKLDMPFPFEGDVVWLTAEQGGRDSGPPVPSADYDYATTAFVPPQTAEFGLASFVLRGFAAGQWRSPAEGRWLLVANDGDQLVKRGSVVVVTEGVRPVAYFHVHRVQEEGAAGFT